MAASQLLRGDLLQVPSSISILRAILFHLAHSLARRTVANFSEHRARAGVNSATSIMLTRVLPLLLLSALPICAAPIAPVPPTDQERTATVLKNLEPDGLDIIATVTHDKSGNKLIFHLTDSARKILDAEDFDTPDADWDQDKWKLFVVSRFGNSFSYLLDRVTDWPSKEVHVVIGNMGDVRKTKAGFAVDGVILMDVRLLQDIWAKKEIYTSETTPAHELTHIYQRPEDLQNRDTYRREFSAVLVELAYLRHDLETLLDPQHRAGETNPFYLSIPRGIGARPSTQEILDPQSRSYVVWRDIGFVLQNNVLSGTYAFNSFKAREFPDAPAARAARILIWEKFVLRYARHPQVGDAAFDQSAREYGLLDAAGKPLTITTLRVDVAHELELQAQPEPEQAAKTTQ